MFLKTFIVLMICLLSTNGLDPALKPRAHEEEEWTYDSQNDWNKHFKSCNGSRESPIDIDTKKLKIDTKLKINFHNYNQNYHKTTAQNNGHTVRVFLHPNKKNTIPYVTGEAINGKFNLDSFHLHWGSDEFNGSEHSIDGRKRSAELHLLHWNSKYGDVNKAMNRLDGVVVISVFIETKLITEFGVFELETDNALLTPIIQQLTKIRDFSKKIQIKEPVNLKALLPEDRNVFYKYDGSLTTPPCSETATFIIFVKPIYIAANQISQFGHINGEPIKGVAKPLSHNYREQQPINGRKVWISSPYSKNNININ